MPANWSLLSYQVRNARPVAANEAFLSTRRRAKGEKVRFWYQTLACIKVEIRILSMAAGVPHMRGTRSDIDGSAGSPRARRLQTYPDNVNNTIKIIQSHSIWMPLDWRSQHDVGLKTGGRAAILSRSYYIIMVYGFACVARARDWWIELADRTCFSCKKGKNNSFKLTFSH